LNDMKKGANFIPNGGGGGADVVRVVDPRNNKTKKYYFRSQGVKDREMNKLQVRNKALQGITALAQKDKTSKDALFALLSKFGPRLDPRIEGGIGFMFDATVLAAPDKNGVIIMYDDAPYLLWVNNAAGLFPGTDLTPVPVFVAGAQTVTVPGVGSQAVTLLISVTQEELKAAIYGDQASSSDSGSGTAAASPPTTAAEEYRTWKDSSGKFAIEATLVSVNDEEVVLKKRDGKKITVKLNKLSAADRKYLKK